MTLYTSIYMSFGEHMCALLILAMTGIAAL